MFERFTDRARRVIVLAQNEARSLDHDSVGTEHILLALVEEGTGVGARALEAMQITTDTVREKVEEISGRGQVPPRKGHIPFTPAAKKVLEFSLREALQLGHTYIGTEHILLGLVREDEGVAGQVLAGLGADLNRTRQLVIEIVTGRHQSEAAPVAGEDLRDRLASVAARLALIERRLRDVAAGG
jgi:ATP-dependent Clp protease ATP-binding subunit ClpC